MPTTAPLDRYIRRALGDKQATIFGNSSLPKPTLIQGKVARILVYRGCFNPPHQGHLDTLCHGFYLGGHDLNMIASLVFFLPDSAVRAKYAHANDIKSIVFTQEERIKLFNTGAIHSSWHYCYPLGRTGSSGEFLYRLSKEAARDGFEIEFVALTRPDHLGFVGDDRIFCTRTIVASTGHPERTRFRAENQTGLHRLHNYSDWRMLPLTAAAIQAFRQGGADCLEHQLMMMFPKDAVDLPDETKQRVLAVKSRLRKGIRRLGHVRECLHLTGSDDQWVRYVPTKFFGMQGEAWLLGNPEQDKQISSTRIRKILAHVEDKKKMAKTLSDLALGPDLLVEYMCRYKAEEARTKIEARLEAGKWIQAQKAMEVQKTKQSQDNVVPTDVKKPKYGRLRKRKSERAHGGAVIGQA
jgi:hypothetical protein